MSRSIGDTVAKKVGVTWKPNINGLTLQTNQESIVVVASDGLWETMSNKQVIQTLKPFFADFDSKMACK